LNFEAIT
jgi:hypothetical protein